MLPLISKGLRMPASLAPHIEPISVEELQALRTVKRGAAAVPPERRAAFVSRGWVEEKYGGIVLTALGRYQLGLRARESGIPMLASRWRRRAAELHAVAASTSAGETAGVAALAARWARLADDIEEIERLEAAEPVLGPPSDTMR